MTWKQTLIVASAGLLFAGVRMVAQTGATGRVTHDVFVQAVPGPDSRQTVERRMAVLQGIGIPGGAAEYMSAEFGLPGAVVKGAPYSADCVTETTLVLADGNRITHKSSTSIARDNEGRTRRDVSFPLLGDSGVAGKMAPRISVIYDPVADVSYTLEHNEKVARKLAGRGVMIHMESSSGGGGQVRLPNAQTDVMFEKGPMVVKMRDGEPGKTEPLGKQAIEGIVAEGTRITTVIPAGRIGNERPIEVVSERWYSPDLQTVVMTRHVDPRSGETVFKLFNVRRGEPLKSLFEVPADYTVKVENSRQTHEMQIRHKE